MLQPDGTILEGYFDMNVFKGHNPPDDLDEVIEEEIFEENKETG